MLELFELPLLTFEECKVNGYRERTKINASADATLAFAVDFTTAGEKLTKTSVLGQGKLYIPIDISQSLTIEEHDVQFVVNTFNSNNVSHINIAGNGLYSMKNIYTQRDLNNFVYHFLARITKHKNLYNPIQTIRSGGQTGIDEAGAVAGVILGIPTTILAPKGWVFRDEYGKDIVDEKLFKARFDKVIDWVKSKKNEGTI